MSWRKLVRYWKDVHDVPDEYALLIGKIMAKWAHIQYLLNMTTYGLLKIDPKAGRVVVREPKAKEYMEMYADILTIRNISIKTDIGKLASDLDEAETERNRYAHGHWGEDPKKPGVLGVRKIRGWWQPAGLTKQTKGQMKKISRKLIPEYVVKKADDLKEPLKKMDDLIIRLEKLAKELNVALPT